jgi:hypothetical protein
MAARDLDEFVVAGVADPGERQTETRAGFPGLNEPGYILPPLVPAAGRAAPNAV